MDQTTAADLLVVSEDLIVLAALPAHPRITFMHTPTPDGGKVNLATKRNLAVRASGADVIVHWDDDDWHAFDRIERSIAAISANGVVACGTRNVLYLDERTGHSFRYRFTGSWQYFLGATLAYRRSFALSYPFDQRLDRAEDLHFLRGLPAAACAELDDIVLCSIHGRNNSPKPTTNPAFTPEALPPAWRRIVDRAAVRRRF